LCALHTEWYIALSISLERHDSIANITQVNVSSWYFLPLYFQAVRGASPVRSGVLLMPIVVIQALVGVAVGGIIYRYGCVRPVVWTGMLLTSLGFGLFVVMGATTPLPSLVAIEAVAAIGIGSVFQAPLIAYQATVDAADTAVATALFGFIRSLSTSISVVIGGVVFQNTMREHSDKLSVVLGNASLAQDFSAANATSSVLVVQTLSLVQQGSVKDAYVGSLQAMWKMYAIVGGCGFLAALFMKSHVLVASSLEEAEVNEPASVHTDGIELSRRQDVG
jgi:hydrogenase/urease accessory protein HupE